MPPSPRFVATIRLPARPVVVPLDPATIGARVSLRWATPDDVRRWPFVAAVLGLEVRGRWHAARRLLSRASGRGVLTTFRSARSTVLSRITIDVDPLRATYSHVDYY